MEASACVSTICDVACEYGKCKGATSSRTGCGAAVEAGRVLASAEQVVAGNSGDLLDERCADESDAHVEHGRTEARMEQVEGACAGDW